MHSSSKSRGMAIIMALCARQLLIEENIDHPLEERYESAY
jgi:hypothetical protein